MKWIAELLVRRNQVSYVVWRFMLLPMLFLVEANSPFEVERVELLWFVERKSSGLAQLSTDGNSQQGFLMPIEGQLAWSDLLLL